MTVNNPPKLPRSNALNGPVLGSAKSVGTATKSEGRQIASASSAHAGIDNLKPLGSAGAKQTMARRQSTFPAALRAQSVSDPSASATDAPAAKPSVAPVLPSMSDSVLEGVLGKIPGLLTRSFSAMKPIDHGSRLNSWMR